VGWIVLLGCTVSVNAQVHSELSSELIFIENKGQWPSEINFYADIPGGQIFVRSNKLTFSFYDKEQYEILSQSHHLDGANGKSAGLNVYQLDQYAMDLSFPGSNSAIRPIGKEKTSTRYNYFLSANEKEWVKGARGYKVVVIPGLYNGVDLVLSSDKAGLKYDLRVAAGTDPSCIKIKYDGAQKIELIEGELSITTPFETMKELMPASFAISGSSRRQIGSRYLLDDDIISIAVDELDSLEELVIDPLLVFSTYSGSAADNWGNTATYDELGNAYAGGMVNHTRGGVFTGEFPATPGAYQTEYGGLWDIGILKFDSTGSDLLYATYLGGSDSEVPQSLLVNEAGELLILGVTGSANFPVTSNAYDTTYNGGISFDLIGGTPFVGSDIFVAKLSEDGSDLLASTYIGGSLNDGILPPSSSLVRNYGDESRGDIAFDGLGNIIVTSRTYSTDFPLKSGLQNAFGGEVDAVVFKFNPELSDLMFSTYIGGSGSETGLSVKIDSADNIFLGGGTNSPDFPTTNGVLFEDYQGDRDGWLAHLTGSGDSLISATYLGTDAYDQVFFIDLDEQQNVYVAGQTAGIYPITPGVFSQGTSGQFIQKIGNNLDTVLFSTVINQVDRTLPAISLTAFLVNECNNIYLSGWGSNNTIFVRSQSHILLNTTGLPVTSDAFQPTTDGSAFYMIVLTGDASEMLYGTFLGDASSLVHVDGGTSRFDKHGIVYHSVCASCFGDSSFPTTEGAWSRTNGSSGCNNAIFKFDLASLRARIQTNSIELDNPGLNQGCTTLDIVFQNFSTGGELFEWDFGDGTTFTTTDRLDLLHSYTEPGTYQVKLRASDPNTCISEDFAYTTIVASSSTFTMSPSADLCAGDVLQLKATGGDRYTWFPATGLDRPNIANPRASPADTTQYILTIENNNGCSFKDSLTINVIPQVEIDIRIERSNLCAGSREIEVINNSLNLTGVYWQFGDGAGSEELAPVYEYQGDGLYEFSATLFNDKCQQRFSEEIPVQKIFVPNIITRNADGVNDKFKITSPYPIDLTIFNRWGQPVYRQLNYQNDWQGDGLVTGVYYYDILLPNREQCSGWLQIVDGI
jgi:hypothetical protein